MDGSNGATAGDRPDGRDAQAGLRSRVPAVLAVLGGLLLVVGLLGFVQGGADAVRAQEPIDLDLNLVAGQRLRDREPLYDLDASRREAVALGGRPLEGSYTEPTNGFPGAPTTALLHAPFTLVDHGPGVTLFRVASLLGMLGAVALTVSTLPRRSRPVGALLGVGGLVGSYACFQTLFLGQGHGFVMLGLALGLRGAAGRREGSAGVGLAVAALLKLSPAALLLHLVVRGWRRAAVAAVGAGVALCALAAALGRPGDLIVWVRDIVPGVSGGIVGSHNQSLPGYLARVAGGADLLSATPVGAWRLLAPPLLLGSVVLLARWRRRRPVDPLELGILVLVGLVAGPLSWVHYTAWAILPVVLLADERRWRHLSDRAVAAALVAIGGGLLLLTSAVGRPAEASLVERLASGPHLLAVVLLLGVAVGLLHASPIDGGPAARLASEATDEARRPPIAADVLAPTG